MKKALKFLFYILVFLIVAIIGCASFVYFFLPRVDKAPQLSIEKTPERIERGRYLANSVTVCIDCHSRRDWSLYSGPITKGTEGSGGERFDQQFGFPGVYYAKNITPSGIGNWTDGELFRVITTGVNKNGKAMFPVMPYLYYGKLDQEDIYSIIAYIRTLAPINKNIPESTSDFPFNFIINTIPKNANLQSKPSESDSVNYGKYLVTAAGCAECHTKVDKGQIIAGLEFGGGREFTMPFGIIRTANITSDKTGIGNWSAEKFVRTFKQYQDTSYHSPKIGKDDFNSLMPWSMYSKMKESDLRCIYQYLRTVKPIENLVEKFSAKR